MASNLMELNLVHSDLGITIYFSENMTKKKQVYHILLHLKKITHKILVHIDGSEFNELIY